MVVRRMVAVAVGAVVALGLAAGPSSSGSYRDIEKQVVEHVLPNGLRFLFLEREDAPVFSFASVVHAGAVDEQYGIGGIAHMMEHMAFKGTETVGTTDYEAEAEALRRVDEAFEELLAERRKGIGADSTELIRLETEFRRAQAAADSFVVPNAFDRILEEQGARGVNAGTGADMTMYMYALPSNKLELWALMESDRLSAPVFREFYKENEVVQEERRMRYESTPSGRLMDEFLSVAYKDHPYGHGIIGTSSDLQSFTRRDGIEFRDTYYIANNMTVAVVGDVDSRTAIPMVERYFGRVPSGPKPPSVDTKESAQAAERRVIMQDPAQPFLFVGYHIPGMTHPDHDACRALCDILAQGRSSRLYRELVKNRKLAVDVGGYAGYPGSQYATLAFFYVVASAGTDIHAVESAFHEVLAGLTKEPVSREELDAYKARAKASFIGGLRSDTGLAIQLAIYDRLRGGWRNLFTHLDRVEAITTDDLQRVAAQVFRKHNRTVALIEPPLEVASEETEPQRSK
jgi:predicted Zn-dependent peptidase